MFDYDWFTGPAFHQQQDDARIRCAQKKFPDVDPVEAPDDSDCGRFLDELELRVLLYLRDGFSYEMKEIASVDSRSHLTFECEPVDDHYKVGAFVVSLPFEEIVRVEVFAVHTSEKPEDMPLITGFRAGPEQPLPPPREEAHGRPQPVGRTLPA